MVTKAIVPDYALGTHVAALGLTFSDLQAIPASFSEGAFIGEHGSFNRNPPAGYKVVFVPIRDGQPSGNPVDFFSDLVVKEGHARRWPVGGVVDRHGLLRVADYLGHLAMRASSGMI